MSLAVQPISVGNALRVFVMPPNGAASWRVLRKPGAAATFAGAGDTSALLLVDLSTDDTPLDLWGLENGSPVTYAAFYTMADGSTVADVPVSATPAATYAGAGADPQLVVRDRLMAGLAVEVARGKLTPVSGKVPVFTSPMVLPETVTFPCVSVHLESTGPDQRSVGEQGFTLDAIGGQWADSEGWLASTVLGITCTSKSEDERIALRMAVNRILLANLEVFDALGFVSVTFRATETEDLTSQAAPLFMTSFAFSCLNPTLVSDAPFPVAGTGYLASPTITTPQG